MVIHILAAGTDGSGKAPLKSRAKAATRNNKAQSEMAGLCYCSKPAPELAVQQIKLRKFRS
jgi:hypothetical protein